MSEAVSNSGAGSVERIWVRWGATAVAAAVIADIMFNITVAPGENGGTGPMLGVGAVLVVLGAVLYLAVFPRVENTTRWALVLGIVTALSLLAFWSGLPLLLAPAVYVLWSHARSSLPARVGLGLAAIAAAVDVVAAVMNALD